jgi:hypothetical protein
MQPNIPLPTDNIYKFAALFGLVVFISTMLAMAYLTGKNNELVFKYFEESLSLEAQENPSIADIVKKVLLERNLDVNVAALTIYWYIMWITSGIAASFSVCSGLYWYKRVQPKQDELLNLQIEKMKREIQVLEKQLEKKETE